MTKNKTARTAGLIISWLCVAVCMAAIFLFSAQNAEESQELSNRFAFLLRFPELVAVIRKLAHYLEFTALGASLSFALFFTFNRRKPLHTFAAGFLYAASDEFHQLFVDGRAGRVFDVFIDSLGVFSGILFFYAVMFLFTKLRRNSHDN